MTQLEGLKNYSLNINGIMEKLHTTKNPTVKLSFSEAHSLVNFYLEVVDYLSKQTE
jgi:hypothetical protein